MWGLILCYVVQFLTFEIIRFSIIPYELKYKSFALLGPLPLSLYYPYIHLGIRYS